MCDMEKGRALLDGETAGNKKGQVVELLLGQDGMITIYLSLVFLLIMGVSFCVIEGVREYQLSSLEEDAFISAGRGILANYDRQLYSQYQLFFLDPRERSGLLQEGKDILDQRFISKGFYAASCRNLEAGEEVFATDRQGRVLHHQIRELMKYETVGEAAGRLTEWICLLQKEDYDRQRDRIEDIQDREEAAEEEKESKERDGNKETDNTAEGDGNTGADDGGTEGQKDPAASPEGRRWKALKSTLSGIIRAGILNYVVDDPKILSQARIPEGGLPSHMTDQGGTSSVSLPDISFSGLGYVSSYFSHNLAEDYRGPVPLEDMMDIQYACLHFNHYGAVVNKEAFLKYEMEYLCIGRKSDLDNLKGVVRRIILLRFATNFAFACRDSEIAGEAETMADILAGAVGMPALASAVKASLIGVLSYGETLLDVHTLLEGGRIPLVKSSDAWNLTFFNAPEKLAEKSRVKEGRYNLDYENFLQIILLCQRKKVRMLYRMMDLMQMNIRQKEAGFFMKDCLFSFKLKGSLYAGKWFPVIPVFDLISEKVIHTDFTRVFSY